MMIDPADEKVLRAKYLDWCSAKVADRFQELTPDQIYDLAHEAPPPAPVDQGGRVAVESPVPGAAAEHSSMPAASSSPAPAGLSYRLLVERVTEVLAARLQLPSYEEWVEAYRASPERYEAELLGLWRGRV